MVLKGDAVYVKNKYPEIVIDKRENAVNGNNATIRLTVEDYVDLLHHTHKASDIIGYTPGEGGSLDPTIIERIETLEVANASMQSQIEDLKQKNEELMDIVKSFYMIDTSNGQDIL